MFIKWYKLQSLLQSKYTSNKCLKLMWPKLWVTSHKFVQLVIKIAYFCIYTIYQRVKVHCLRLMRFLSQNNYHQNFINFGPHLPHPAKFLDNLINIHGFQKMQLLDSRQPVYWFIRQCTGCKSHIKWLKKSKNLLSCIQL